jgi:transposase
MSTSLLYHAFGVRGYDYVGTQYVCGQTYFRVRAKRDKLRCPVCHSQDIILRGYTTRTFRTVSIGMRPTHIVLDVPRVGCRQCNAVRQVHVSFADARRGYTHSFERQVIQLSRMMTIQDIALYLDVTWGIVKDIQKRNLTRKYKQIPLGALREIAIDEICIGRGHKYFTVVLDLRTGAVVFIGSGKGANALKPFWKRLKRSRAKVQAVAMDMSPSYISAVKNNLPKAAIVFDRFHLIKLFNEQLSDLRRDMYREATDLMHKQVMKGIRWLLLKNPENLDDTKDEPRRLNEALKMNQPLATAYYMRDELRMAWEQPNKEAARNHLLRWVYRAESSGIRMLTKFAKTVMIHLEGILNYYDYRISTGPLEGTNTKIRVLQRSAYGFRDAEFFKLKIYGLHETKFKLVG